MSKPLLSIGIIFKNEIRCLERCLKSLQPIRDALPCELVMADTGADDGSREIAEKYADVLFDFPWVNDFSAARNAVMDRCSGKWFLCIDCDEWFDENVSPLIGFICNKQRKENYAALTVRNHDSYDGGSSYTDFVTIRMVRMSTGQRYIGAIHEHWEVSGKIQVFFLSDLYLNHDGYVSLNGEGGENKRERNLSLIREKLKADPDDLLTLMQYIESGKSEADYLDVVQRARRLVEEKQGDWKVLGPPILRYAVEAAYNHNLPEFEEWIKTAQEMFPDSYYIRVDVGYLAFGHSFEKKDYDTAIIRGKQYLRAVEDYHENRLKDLNARMYSVVKVAAPYWVQCIKIFMAVAYVNLGQPEKVPALMRNFNWDILDVQQTTNLAKLVSLMQSFTQVDTSELVTKVWKGIVAPNPTQQAADERKVAFVNYMGTFFLPRYRMEEEGKSKFQRYAYTVLIPLEKCFELGRSAVVMDTDDPVLLSEKLGEVEHWDEFSIYALVHALERGAAFPPAGKPLNLEEMDALINRLPKTQNQFFALVQQVADSIDMEDWQQIVWARRLLLSAVQLYPWGGQDVDRGMAIAQAFSRMEGEFLPRCYNSDVLQPDQLFLLPPLHRFGWYCAQAFQALEQGNTAEYVHMLRKGLSTCESMKDMVEFLLEYTESVQKLLLPPELRSLANQIQVILARFAPDDPAVEALKQSEAYRKVAHLLEGPVVYARAGNSKS